MPEQKTAALSLTREDWLTIWCALDGMRHSKDGLRREQITRLARLVDETAISLKG